MKKLNELQSCLTRLRGLMLTLIILCSIGSGNAWGESFTFTPTSSSAGTLTSAPTGVTATFSNTYNSANQITKNNSQTLTLSGLDGCTITGVSVSVHNNKSSGAGSGSLTINGSNKGSLSSITGLGNSSWKTKDFTVTSTEVATGGTVVVTISCSTSSVYCNLYTITYTPASGPTCSTNPTVGGSSNSSINVTGGTVSCTGITKGDCDIDEWGFVYGTATEPTGNAQKVSSGKSTSNVSSFNKALTGLDPNQKYYVRAYAKVGSSTFYGSETNFTTKTITASSSNTTYGTVSRNKMVITGSPKSGGQYASPAYTISGSTPANATTVSQVGNTFTVTSTSTTNITVTINFEAVPTYTVTWVAGSNSSFNSQTGTAGTALTNPGTPSAASYCPGGKVFVGWTETPIVGETNTVPADLFSSAEATSKTIPSGGTTYYAVFATEAASNSYTQITAEADLEAGKNYLIVGYASSTYKALPVDAASSLTTVSVSSSSISSPAAALIWTLEGSADAWKIKSTNNNKYLQISGGSLTFETSTSLTFSVGVSSSVFTFTSSASSGNKILSYYANGNCFNAYTKANTVYVYKQGVTRSAYATTCCTPWDDPTFSYNTYSLTAGGAHATKTITGTTHGTLSFESSNTGVITVNETTGEVTPVGAGTAHVIASWTAADGYCAKEMNSSDFTVTGNVTVTFKRNGGGGAADNQTQSVPYNTATALKTLAQVGYTAPSCKEFYGWADSQAKADAGTRDYTDGQSVTLTTGKTLYAVWKTIQYTVARGTGTATGCSGGTFTFSPSTVDCGGTVTITSSPDDNHKGSPTVTILPAGSGTVSGNTITGVSGNITSISVSYAEKVDVTATWNVNNGSVTSGGTTTQKEGSTFTFPNVTSTDCGTFLGWTDAAHSSYSSTSGTPTPFYTAGSTTTLNENTQFYAVYSKVSDDAVSATLYAHDGNVNSITNAGYTNTTVTATGISTTNTTNYKTKFDDVGDKVIFQLDGTPTSFSAAFQTPSSGTSGTSTIKLYESSSTSGPWTEITSTSITTSSTSATLSETRPAKFTQRIVKLEMTSKGYNMMCGDITIVGLRAPINYTTNPGCVDWVLDAINVTTAPTKTTYDECEAFDPTGMAVTATMKENGNPSNTTTKDVAGYTWTPTQFLTPGNSIPVTISYTEKGVTRTTTQTVRVNDLPNYTITFHDGDGTTTWTQSNHCDACNLDSRTGSLACGDYTFAGWSTSSTTYDDENATITTWVSGSYTPTANTHLYAVYLKGAAPAEFTANCIGGTFTIGTKNGGSTIISHAANVGSFNSYEYGVANSDYTEDQLGKFLFEKVGENTYKISLERNDDYGGGIKRFYIAPDDYSAGTIEFLETYDANQCKWKVVAGTSGSWRIYTEFRNSYVTKDYGIAGRGNDGATPRFKLVPTSNINGSDNYDVELSPVSTPVYQSNPNCASTYTITFNTHGGTFVQGNYAYATETTSGLSGTTTSKFPSATLSGCTFAGWKEGSVQEEVASSSEGDAPILIAADANMSVSSNKTYHAVYHYYDEDWSFDPKEGGTYHMYATISGTKHFCSGTPGTSYAILTSTTDCNDVVDVVITPGTGANVGKYKINIGGYDVSPELNGTGLKRGTFWWNIAEVDDNLYHITADGAESGRSLNYYSTSSAFTHYKDNGAGNTKDISFGRCRQHHWTSEPVLVPMVVLNSNSNIMVTSTNGQTLRSTTMLTVTATHYGETTKIYLSANVAGVGFLKSDGTALSSDAGGSYLQTDAEGELATSVYVTYAPTVTTDGIENVTITARDGHSPSPLSQTTRSAQVRHLPTKFIIAQKVGDDWYALPNDMSNNYTSSTAAVKLSSVNESTGVATFYSEVTDQFAYQLRASKGLDNKGMVFSSPVKSNNVIKANTTSSISTIGLYAQSGWTGANVQYYEFTPTTNDLVDYTLKNTFQNNFLGITTGTWGIGSTNNVRFFSIDQQPAATITWQNDMLEAVHATNKAENGVVTLPTGANPLSCNEPSGLLTFDGWVTATWSGYKTTGFTKVVGGEPATSDVTYYAVFKDANNRYYTQCPTIYSITYKANGGTGSDYVVYTMNTTADAVAVATAGFTKEGSTFVGWTNPANAEGTIITPGAGKITGLSGDITLNAVWIGTTTLSGTVRLTSSDREKVATATNAVTISSTDFACATTLRITYKDVTNDVTYGRSGTPSYTSSEFRLCNGSYGSADGTNISLAEVSGAYNQTFSITYEPNGGANTLDHYQLKVEVLLKNTVIETKTLELYGRTLPTSFAIATKIGGSWYALPNNMGSEGTYDPILISVTEDANVLNWTAQGPSTAAYKMKDYTVNYSRLRFAANDANQYCLWAADGNAAGIRNYSATSTYAAYGWIVTETNADFSGYTMATSNNTRTGLMISNNKWGMANSGNSEIHFIPLTTIETIDIIAREWKTNGLVFAIDADNNISTTSGHTQYGIDAAPSTNVTSITRHSTGGYGLYEVGLADITGDYGKVLSLKMKIGGDDKIANVTIPIIVSGTDVTTAASEPFTTLDAATKDYDVVILDGAKLTTDATASHASSFHNFYVYSGGTWINDNGSTSLNYLELRGGIKGIGAKDSHEQGVPHVLLNKAVSSTNGANLDMTVYTDHGYALSVPFDVDLSKVNFANSLKPGTGAQVNGTLASQFWIRKYDGEVRANNGRGGWVDITPADNKTIHAGEGYTLQGKRPKGQPFAVIRFPFTGVNTWANANGEVAKADIPIYAYEGGANTPDNDKGWNLIANPYMATIAYNTEDELSWAASFKVGNLEKTDGANWDGKYQWTDASHAYVTVPNDSYTAFPQTRASKATFYPFKNFFIQASSNGVVAFERTDRSEIHQRLMAQEEQMAPIFADINLAHGSESAQAGLTIDAGATAGYKFGEDYTIFESREELDYLKVYTIADGHYLVGNTLTPAETTEMIPLEFYAPNTTGEYVFSLDEGSDIDRLEYVILYDAELGLNTNLLTGSYAVELDKTGLIENRFSIGLKIKEEEHVTTGTGDVDDEAERPFKFIHNDKMYILRNGKLYDATGKMVREINK